MVMALVILQEKAEEEERNKIQFYKKPLKQTLEGFLFYRTTVMCPI